MDKFQADCGVRSRALRRRVKADKETFAGGRKAGCCGGAGRAPRPLGFGQAAMLRFNFGILEMPGAS